MHGLAVLDLIDAGRIEDFQILERIAVHDDQVCLEAGAHASDLGLLAEDARVVERCMLHDLDRAEARFLMELELANEAEPVHLIDEPRVVPRADEVFDQEAPDPDAPRPVPTVQTAEYDAPPLPLRLPGDAHDNPMATKPLPRESEEQRAARARIPTWDDIMLGVRRKTD